MAKSSSTSSLPKPLTPRSKPSSPRPRSRSKTREDNGFNLWIPESLEDIENQLQSKKRTLELLTPQTESMDLELQEQLLARDKHISSLNKTILDLKTIIRAKEDSKKERNWAKDFAELEKEVTELKKSNKDLEEKNKDILNQLEALTDQWEEEKEEYIIMQETIKEENNELKLTIENKEKEIEEIFADMSQINSIVETMTKLNSELHIKIESKNSEMEKLNIQSHENLIKAKQVEELDERLQEYIDERMSLEKKLSSLLPQIENISRFNNIIDWAEKNLGTLEEGIKERHDYLANIDMEHVEKAMIDINLFFQELASSIITIKHNLIKSRPKPVENIGSEASARVRIVELELELDKNNTYVKTFQSREEALQEQIRDITLMMEKHSLEYKNNVLLALKQSDTFKDQSSRLKEKIDGLRKENDKLSTDLNLAKEKINNLSTRLDQVNKKKAFLIEKENELKAQNAEIKAKLNSILDHKKNTNLSANASEAKLRKIITQAQILRDEVFRKDSELVKAARERLKFEKEIDGHKTSINKLHGKMKTIEAEVIERISSEIDEKNRQIEILKEMLRSAHSEIKIKDSKITTLVKKTETVDRLKN